MMRVFINGVDTPCDCSNCQFLEGDRWDGLCHAANKWLDDDFFTWYQYAEGDIDDSKPLNCPLIEVPDGVAPVVHGKWIYDTERIMGDGWTYKQYHCSVCEGQMIGGLFNYCPHCGAKMDMEA